MADSIKTLLQDARAKLRPVSSTAKLDSECLLGHVLKKPIAYLYTWPEEIPDNNLAHHFKAMIDERIKGIPIAYLTGKTEFWSLDLKVNHATLIPRADTETLVDVILHKQPFAKAQKLDILDLGTGSGAIAIAIAKERPNWQVTAVDFCKDALSIAKENAQLHHCHHIRLIQSNWYQSLDANKHYDIIVSNPPYIAENDLELCKYVRKYEPHSALIAKNNGLDAIEAVIKGGQNFLKKSGFMMIEHGHLQAKQVKALYRKYGYRKITHYQDLAGKDRASSAVR